VVGDLERLEHRLGEHRAMVSGDTDSERVFALMTLCIRQAGGDVRAGITTAVRELAADYELYSINFLLGEVGHLWAFRYPEHNPLLFLEHASWPASRWTPTPAGRTSASASSSTSARTSRSTARRS
jgi:hypothetical protein